MALRQTVGGLAATFVSILRTRFELFMLEAAEQRSNLFLIVGLALGGLIFLVLALLVFTVTIAVYFWPTEDRYIALGILAFIYFVIGVGLLVAMRSRMVNGPSPFAATLEELRRDVELMERLKEHSSVPVPPEWLPPGDRT